MATGGVVDMSGQRCGAPGIGGLCAADPPADLIGSGQNQRAVAAADDRVVVAGDLNAPSDRPEIKRLLSVLYDCGPDTEATYSSRNPYLGKGEWLEDHRIGYILAGRESVEVGTC